TAGDPIKLGLVASLNRPGGNITGVTQLSSELVSKRLGLLHDLIPTATIVGLLVNPTDPRAETQTSDMQEAAHTLGLQIHVLNASTEGEIDTAFASLRQLRAGALLVGTSELFRSKPEQLVALAARERVPAIYQYREYAAAGGLISYGTSLTAAYRLAGIYTGRVLKGEKPADMPVLQPTKFELQAARLQQPARRRGGVAAPGARAAADDAGDRVPCCGHAFIPWPMGRRLCAAAARTRLD
ncbi:MAG: hypothetical protein E6G77_25350, partial [Alphaproteobacteria bacterium]